MRVAVVVTAFPELSVTFILNQIAGLIDRGHEVDIYGDRPGRLDRVHPDVQRYGLLDRTHYPAMPRHPVPRAVKGTGLFIRELWKSPGLALRAMNVFRYRQLAASFVLLYGLQPLTARKTYDIIHCHFGPNGLKGLFFRENGLLAGRLITTFHGYDVSTYPRRAGSGCYKPLFRQGDLFTANTMYTAERMIRLGCPSDKVIILPVGVDPARFAFAERTLKHGEELRILSVGRLFEGKGTEYGIRAVAQTVRRHSRIRYDVVGDGPLRERLARLVDSLGIGERVNLHGGLTQDRVVELYAQAHIFMLPSVIAKNGWQEAQGLVLVEAQASGIPVLSTRTGGIPETVRDGESGFLVPERDADALAERLEFLITHSDQWPAMGRAGRRFVEEHYDIHRLNDELVRLYERALTGR